MAAQNILFSEYLRILTPEEINELTSTSEGNTRVSLTEALNSKLDGIEIDFTKAAEDGGAKILPFKRKKHEKEEFFAGKNVVESIERFFVREVNAETALDEMGREVETSTFIIREKERFSYSQAKLKSIEILNLYKKNVLVDIEQEKIIKNDLSKSTSACILVDKKQF